MFEMKTQHDGAVQKQETHIRESFLIQGMTVQVPTQQEMLRVYEKPGFLEVLDARPVRLGMLKGEYLFGPLRLNSLFQKGSPLQWAQLVAAYYTFPNGQVKNFLVACRTYLGGLGVSKICVRGSKSAQGGGLWHVIYAVLVARTDKEVSIDFFDDCEVASEQSWEGEGFQIRLRWIPEAYLGNGNEYNVMIDDAWVPSQGTVPLNVGTQIFSKKGTEDKIGQLINTDKIVSNPSTFEAFLHPTETRYFSQKKSGFVPICQCMTCQACGSSVSDFTSYKILRSACAIFGHKPDCTGTPFLLHEFLRMGNNLQKLMTQPILKEFQVGDLRSLVCISDFTPLKVVEGGSVSYAPDRKATPIEVHHTIGVVAILPEKEVVIERYKHRKVAFVGVPPEILGSTPIIPVKTQGSFLSVDVEFLFLSGVEAASMTMVAAPVVLFPARDHEQVIKMFPHLMRNDLHCGQYWEYVIRRQPEPAKEMYYQFRGEKKEAIELFPVVEDEQGDAELTVVSHVKEIYQISEMVTGQNSITLRDLEREVSIEDLLIRSREGFYSTVDTVDQVVQVSKRAGLFLCGLSEYNGYYTPQWFTDEQREDLSGRERGPIKVKVTRLEEDRGLQRKNNECMFLADLRLDKVKWRLKSCDHTECMCLWQLSERRKNGITYKTRKKTQKDKLRDLSEQVFGKNKKEDLSRRTNKELSSSVRGSSSVVQAQKYKVSE